MATIPADLLDRIRALERAVRDLAGRASTRPALTRVADGTVRVEDGGQLVVTPAGADFATFAVGQWPDGAFGTVLRRADGTYALTVEGSNADRGTWRLWNRDTAEAERVLLGDDRHSGRFLGRPHMPLYLYPTAEQRSTSQEWANAWTGIGPAHNAVAVIKVSSYAEDGGRVRVRTRHSAAEEAAVIDEWDVPADAWTNRTITRPLHGVGYLGDLAVQIEHRTSGRHPIETRLFAAYTRGTLTPDEAPDPPAGRSPDATTTTDPRLDVETDDAGDTTTPTT
ncbi:hypothetical protein [Streptomyces litchfieldiae]|uniref:Uncharacterized protein n=1 Tax=Streptomyces litchfieldiae TaxID=3075543 RepID=A0ABU2MZQ4_9ACTN|nr:hypothetical protein [Streptomyces sp. DSM 44938]MDT0346753.1 hypothetical protein [Streptomyces sp. DSM 44938]